jgi:hypothetical protein
MIVQGREIRVRLLLGIGLVVVLASAYVRALAVASAYGTFSGMVRPWQHVGTDLLLFVLSAGALVCLFPVVRSGGWAQRIVGILLVTGPLLVLGHFITWLILDYQQWGG